MTNNMWDIFNIKSLKNAESELSQLKLDLANLQDENEFLKRLIYGERVCGNYCLICKHGFQAVEYKQYGCRINIGCKNFEEKESQ